MESQGSMDRLRPTTAEEIDTLMNEKTWEWTFLRKKCHDFELETYLKTYQERLSASYIVLFMIIQWTIGIMRGLVLLFTLKERDHVYSHMLINGAATTLVCLLMIITLKARFVERYSWIRPFVCWVVVITLTIADLSSIFLHDSIDHSDLRPSYSFYMIYVIYIFMPLSQHMHAVVMGVCISAIYVGSFGISAFHQHIEEDRYMHIPEFAIEIIFLICLNIIGYYTRITKEIAMRTTFLDRRQCVEESLLFRYARDQEKGLLLSILPVQIATKIEQDMKHRIESQKRQSPEGGELLVELRKLFIEPHNDVTILYADLVNYTYLTTQLDVKTLVETIHDLFVKFDIAAQRHNVLRIKFLGDCYYCVSGVPIPNAYHARCCVDLGLCMITDIREVSLKRNLDIDMRIGVHSGSILSGVIGARKWQYDIWSIDVDIANRLEATGVAGRVHVSEQTLKQLDGAYAYEEGTAKARNDEVLRKHEIVTYLIIQKRATFDVLQPAVNNVPDINIDSKDTKHSLAFTKSNIMEFSQIRKQATLEMSREMNKMPIGRVELFQSCCDRNKRTSDNGLELQTLRRNITPLLLFFKDWRREIFYINEPDAMLKYSLLIGLVTFWCIVFMQTIDINQNKYFWTLVLFSNVLLLNCIIMAWYRKLWIMWFGKHDRSMPEKRLSLILFLMSDKFQRNVIARTVAYILLLGIMILTTLLQVVFKIGCDRNKVQNDAFENNVEDREPYKFACFYPWGITNAWTLITCTVFVFTRIPFIVKIVIGFSLIGVYFSFVLYDFDPIFERSDSTDLKFPPEYAHIMLPIITLIVFHFVDRQAEFISKVDFNWKRQLQKKQNDAKFTNETIKILINNILPSHVADIYMRKQIQNELYYEEYNNVACMFATICNYDTENFGLRVLNEIICDFDEILSHYSGNSQVEKIKVAGWTYMAACGVHIDESQSNLRPYSFQSSNLLINSRISNELPGPSISPSIYSRPGSDQSQQIIMPSFESSRLSRGISPPQHSDVVYVMTKFALDMMRTLHIFNTETLQVQEEDANFGKLRIGISNGEVMAGVVGSYKPHYDIWGNAVNMASRMDSTGIPGSIQVTENTANILKSYGVQCTYRGLTFIKGRGETPTYFVGIDKQLNFIPMDVTSSV